LPDIQDNDPIIKQSLIGYYLIAVVLLVITFGWSLYDELFGLRPWKSYQEAFAKRYAAFLRRQIPKQRAAEKAVDSSTEYLALTKQIEDEAHSKEPELDKLH